MTTSDPMGTNKAARPLGVWLFSIYFVLTSVANVASPLLFAYSAPQASHALQKQFGVDPEINLVLSILLSTIGVVAGVVLFLLRRAAIHLLLALLVSSALVAVWHFSTTKTLEVAGPLALLSPILALSLIAWGLLYSKGLDRGSRLH